VTERRVVKHKRGWAVEEHQIGGYFPGKKVLAVYRSKVEAERHKEDGPCAQVASEETRTWTVLLTRPDGISCAVAAGRGWEPKRKGAPA